MAVVYTVQAGSREECASRIARLCDLLGLEPTLAPVCSLGTGRWMARAAVPDPEPVPEHG